MSEYMHYAAPIIFIIFAIAAAMAKGHETKVERLLWCQIIILAAIADMLGELSR